MTAKFKNFTDALQGLCLTHGVLLGTSQQGHILVFDRPADAEPSDDFYIDVTREPAQQDH